MPRQRRQVAVGYTFHVTNRGVDRRRLFFEDADYRTFLTLLTRAKQRFAVSFFGLCLMPNHFHAVVRPDEAGALSAYFHWVQGCYSRHLRLGTRTSGHGHVFQQRFWAGLIEDDAHFLNVMRYVEGNSLAAKLVSRADEWPWSSLSLRQRGTDGLLDPLPVPLPAHWRDLVDEEPLPEDAD